MKKLFLPIAALMLIAGLWLALERPDPAPQAKFSTLDGKSITLAELRGKMVLVNFWATSCSGCVAEMPKLVDTYRQYGQQGFELVAVAMSYDPPQHVLNFAKKNALPFPVALDADGKLAEDFGNVQVTPTAVLIDRQGNVVQRVIGELDFATFHKTLDQELRRPVS